MGRIVKAAERRLNAKKLSSAEEELLSEFVALRSEIARLKSAAKNEIIDLALAIARRIVPNAVEMDKAAIDRIYEQALAQAADLESVILYIHPEDRKNSKIDALAEARGFSIVEDGGVGRAGCRIRSPGVEIDATLDAILRALEQAMKGMDNGPSCGGCLSR